MRSFSTLLLSFALLAIVASSLASLGAQLSPAAMMPGHNMSSHSSDMEMSMATNTDCIGDKCSAAASTDCLEHCLAAATATTDKLWFTLISVVLFAITVIILLVEYTPTQKQYSFIDWFRPLYLFNTVRLLE